MTDYLCTEALTPAGPSVDPGARKRRSILLAAMLASSSVVAQDGPSIGYPSVSAALEALSADPSVSIRNEEGWTIADSYEGDDIVIWTFTLPIHAAYPAAVKRIIRKEEDGYLLEMRVLCEAEKEPCDDLVTEFQAINNAMRTRLQQSAQSSDGEESN